MLPHRTGPPVATWPAVGIRKPTQVRQGWEQSFQGLGAEGSREAEVSTRRARGNRLLGPLEQIYSSLRSPWMRNIRGQAGGPESSAIYAQGKD